MEFHDVWFLLALVFYGAGTLCVWATAAVTYDAERVSLWRWWRTFIITWLIGFLLMNGFMLLVSWTSTEDRSATLAEKVGQFDFQSGKSYPLVIGTTATGSYGTGSLSGGMFYIDGSINIQPGSFVRVSFNDDKNWLDIPADSITWNPDNSTKPSMVVYLKNLGSYDDYGPGDDGTETKVLYGPCHFTFDNLVFVCNKPTIGYHTTLSADVQHAGLSKLIEQNLLGAKITLPRSLENELLKQH